MSNFTKGKWVYDELFGVVYNDDTCAVIATVQGAGTGSCFYLSPEGQANARLIAAAPELYRLLKEELIPTSDYGGILSFSREAKVKELLARIDGKEDNHEQPSQ